MARYQFPKKQGADEEPKGKPKGKKKGKAKRKAKRSGEQGLMDEMVNSAKPY